MTLNFGLYQYFIDDNFVKLFRKTVGVDFQEKAIIYVLCETSCDTVDEVCNLLTREEVFRIFMTAAGEELELCGVSLELSEPEKELCEKQAELFAYVAKEGWDFKWFVYEYLKSDFCKEKDSSSAVSHKFMLEELNETIMPELGFPIPYPPGKRFRVNVAEWIGYIYRMLSIKTKILSSDLLEKLPLKRACEYYDSYFEFTKEMAVDLICEELRLEKTLRSNTV